MLAPGDRAGVAVSGGADSVALLRLLENLRERLGVKLLVVHFNHSLRAAESDADARFVEELAAERGIRCVIGREDVAAAAASNKWNLEDAARRLRYAFFERLVTEGRATRVMVAHTADDQAETVLARIFRGTGPTGLAGIRPAIGAVARPLLDERREDLRKYLRGLGQGWREDPTNRDLTRQRARIREQLLPLLEREYSPGIVNRLSGLAELAREEEIFWRALVEDRFRALVQGGVGKFTVRISALLAPLDISTSARDDESSALRVLTERLVRRMYGELRGNAAGLSSKHVALVVRLASASSSGRRVELPGEILAERNFDELVLSHASARGRPHVRRETEFAPNAYLYVVSLPAHGSATVSVPELNRRFCLKVIDWSVSQRDTKRDSTALDAQLLRSPLILRNWRPGDAYRPLGRRQSKKLKELFLAGRVPSRDRAGWPVLESGGRVAWARGLPPSDEFCARNGTQAAVVIEEEQF
ncbi:MAG TPA: tRNA lysidine(34) synthetase TilS [Candidatus Acidoferrum sp.]|jgi:tRNA(Ile)-lysidine synthase|nr:tRNA lysidine(34) synthetase TilS [Candidatus Acidoferrum sp.]